MTATPARVAQYQPHDLHFNLPADALPPGNPFLVDLRARLTAPDGRVRIVPGFYDDDATWVVRVGPDQIGTWRYQVESTVAGLDGHSGEIDCTPNDNPRLHGALRVDPEHPHHFVHQDGTHPFVLGYEANWLWALGFAPNGLARLRHFAARLAGHGFNHLLINTYAHDTTARPGVTGPDDFGPPPLYAWEGTNEQPIHDRPNIAYWRNFDDMMRVLLEHGLTAHLYLRVYNKLVSWPTNGSISDDLFWRYVVARYQGFSNVVWDFSKETFNEPDKAYVANRIDLIRATDGHGRLVTAHDDILFERDPRFRDRSDFVAEQRHRHIGAAAIVSRHRRAVPYINTEFAYEHGAVGPKERPYGQVHAPEDHVLRSWEIVGGGGYPGYYYSFTAWDLIRPEDEPAGYQLHQHLAEFMAEVPFWRLEPQLDLIDGADVWCLGRPGEGYLYISAGRDYTQWDIYISPLGFDLPRRFDCEWLQPLTGERARTTQVFKDQSGLEPPWGGGTPYVVWVRPAAAGTDGGQE